MIHKQTAPLPSSGRPLDRLRQLFSHRPCWTLTELSQKLDYARGSIWRFLKQEGYFRSYTHNGQWYTLRNIPRFSREGLWWHQDLGFSRQGNLIATIEHLLARSPTGFSTAELEARLHHPCQTVLSHLHRDGRLVRVKTEGVYRYLATSAKIQQQQREQIEAQTPVPPPPALSAQASLWVLVELIQHPEWSLEQIAVQLQHRRQMAVSVESIARFLEEQGVKKTAEPSTAKSWRSSARRPSVSSGIVRSRRCSPSR
jgi:transposase